MSDSLIIKASKILIRHLSYKCGSDHQRCSDSEDHGGR